MESIITLVTRKVISEKQIELKVIIIGEISVVSRELFYQVLPRLIEIFDCKTDKTFV